MNQQRLKLVVENMKKAGLHQMIVTETEPVYYLTGIWVAPMERMMAVYLDDTGRVIFFGNKLFGVLPQDGMALEEHTDTTAAWRWWFTPSTRVQPRRSCPPRWSISFRRTAATVWDLPLSA